MKPRTDNDSKSTGFLAMSRNGFRESALDSADHDAGNEIFLNERIDDHHRYDRYHDGRIFDQRSVDHYIFTARISHDCIFCGLNCACR